MPSHEQSQRGGTDNGLITHFHHHPFHQRTWNLGFPEECRDGAVSDHTMNHARFSTTIDTELIDLCIKQGLCYGTPVTS